MGARQLSLRVYEKEGDEAYTSSVQVFRYGDKAFLYALSGPGFYAALPEVLNQLLGQGFRTMEFYAGEAHARLLRRVLAREGRMEATVGEEGLLDGHRLFWITVRRKGS